MRTLVALSIFLCACSQGDRLPPNLGDCDACGPTKGHDASAFDVTTQDATQDAPQDAPQDVTSDAPADANVDDASDAANEAGDGGLDSSDDGALLDTGAGD